MDARYTYEHGAQSGEEGSENNVAGIQQSQPVYYHSQQLGQQPQAFQPTAMYYSYSQPQQQYYPPTYPYAQPYTQPWPGYGQPSSTFVDVTTSSKINYEDDEDEDDVGKVKHDTSRQHQQGSVFKLEDQIANDYATGSLEGAVDVTTASPAKDTYSDDEKRDSGDEMFAGDAGDSSEVVIPGTSIVLKTDEDINKWREERKRMWLIKISNQKELHKKQLNIKDEELKHSPFQEVKKERNFIQSIQNQVKRSNQRPNLTIGIHQRTLKDENVKILEFIKELGDKDYLKYELTENEKSVLFGSKDRKDDFRRPYGRYDRSNNFRSNQGQGFNQRRKRTIEHV